MLAEVQFAEGKLVEAEPAVKKAKMEVAAMLTVARSAFSVLALELPLMAVVVPMEVELAALEPGWKCFAVEEAVMKLAEEKLADVVPAARVTAVAKPAGRKAAAESSLPTSGGLREVAKISGRDHRTVKACEEALQVLQVPFVQGCG